MCASAFLSVFASVYYKSVLLNVCLSVCLCRNLVVTIERLGGGMMGRWLQTMVENHPDWYCFFSNPTITMGRDDRQYEDRLKRRCVKREERELGEREHGDTN